MDSTRQDEELIDKFIQDRLVQRDHTLKSIIKQYVEFLYSEPSQGVKDEFLSDVNAYEFQIAKATRAIQNQQQDRTNLVAEHETIVKKIKLTQERIEDLRKEYQLEEQIKNNRVQYENVATQIIQYDDLDIAAGKIDSVLKAIEELKSSHSVKMKKITQKKRHLQLLLSTMKELTDDS